MVANFGNYYDVDTSMFVCRDNDLYVFFATVLSSFETPVWFAIVKDNVIQGNGYTGATSAGMNSGTDMAIVQCTERSQIWVKCSHTNPRQQVHSAHSFFGGFRIGTNDF